MIQISVALVTRNRAQSLDVTLKSLRSQSVQPFEVVVSDDSDPDRAHETREIAARWNCRYVEGPRRGLYANRNHAALACEGSHVRTMDDDHLFPPGHFEQCLEAIQSDPDSIWTTGERGFIGGKLYGSALTASQLGASGVSESIQDKNDNWAIADGSTIYPRKVFDQGHRMVEYFSYGSSYLEFGAYLYYKGFKSRCIPNCIVEHYPENTSILLRARTPAAIESSLFASICYNLYFRPNAYFSLRYLLPKMARLSSFQCSFGGVLQCFDNAEKRWNQKA